MHCVSTNIVSKKIIKNFLMKTKIGLLAVSLVLILSCNQPQTKIQSPAFSEGIPSSVSVSEARLGRIDNVIKQGIDSGWIAGAVGFIARDGKIVYDKAFGVSDIEKKSLMRRDDIFRIASQTKAITSVAVMTLFEEGKFLLDDPISRYIPEFAHPSVIDKFNEKDSTYTTIPANREVTIRDLLTHTSGIDYAGIGSKTMRAVYAKAGIPGGFGGRNLIGDKMKALGKLPLIHQPGERFTYGLNVDVLGYLVEVLSGESLDKYFRNHIFEPLGMNDTYFYLPESKYERLVKVFTEDKNRHLINVTDDFVNYPQTSGTYFSGGAGLSSTIKDYAVFLQMMLNNGEYNGKRILARRTVELMTCNQIGDLNVGRDKFGLGFQVTTKNGQTRLGVTEGSFAWGGYFGTTYWADPKEKLVCLLFINQSPLRHGEIQDKFRALVYQALAD
jgi:CubicO group peptidase (beta-lactamase class C family)